MMTNPSYETHIPVPPNPSPYPEQKTQEESDSLKFHVEPTSSLGYGTASSEPLPPPPQYQMYQDPSSAKPHQDLFVESQEDVFISHIQTTNEPDYLRYSICTMFCCFLPFGIVAVIYSIKVSWWPWFCSVKVSFSGNGCCRWQGAWPFYCCFLKSLLVIFGKMKGTESYGLK